MCDTVSSYGPISVAVDAENWQFYDGTYSFLRVCLVVFSCESLIITTFFVKVAKPMGTLAVHPSQQVTAALQLITLFLSSAPTIPRHSTSTDT